MGFLTRLLAGLTAAAALGAGLTGTANAVDTTGVMADTTGTTKGVVKLSDDGGNETSEDTADNPDDDSTDADSTTDAGAQSDAGQQAEIQSSTSQDKATAKSRPDHIVNGSFDYPACPDGKNSCDVDPTTGWGGFYVDYGRKFMPIPDWDRSKFGWDSSQEGLRPDQQPNSHQKLQHCVQIGNKPNNNGQKMNRFAEIIAETPDEYIYQDIATTPGVMYRWSLKHASENASHVDSMQVMIGSSGKETAQDATRTTSNGRGDRTGVTSKTIATKGGQAEWETYTGVYIATSTVTRFTFKSAQGRDSTRGNFIDDVMFTKAYKLTYDKNSADASGQVPSNQRGKENTTQPAKSKASGTVKTVADDTSNLPDHLVNGDFSVNKNATDANGSVPSDETAGTVKQAKAGTTGTLRLASDDDVATYAASNLPDHIVNGSFDYPSVPSWTALPESGSNKYNKGKLFATINPGTGKYGSGCAMSTTGRAIPNWNRLNFAWSSTQGDTHYSGGMSCEAGNVELNYDSVHHNQFAELTADQQGTAIYQDVKVTPGTMMKWSLKHSSATSAYVDKMQVMIGEPYKETVQEATRIASENGNKVGEKMTTISTPTTSDRADNKKWDTYSGTYLVPDGVTTVRFTFKSVASAEWYSGNDLDDIEFSRSYKLTYDKNSSDAAGSVPSNQRGKENTTQPAKTKTNGKIRLASDTSKLSDHLVNSDFEYLPDGGWKTVDAPSYMTNAYTSVDPNNGQYMRNAQHSDAGLAWVDWPGFDRSKFAWRTDQKGGQDQGGLKDRANAVELQQDSTDGNTYAEMVASETGRTIYQDLATIPGTLYKIRLKHASLCKDNVDKMQVVINGTPIEMTRVTANGKAGDKVGEKSTTIATKVTNENRWHHADQWETYEGYYVIPDGQITTRFGFKAVNYLDPTKGNLLDDVTFARAYKLSYDKNSTDATGEVPSNQRGKENTTQPAKTKTNGTVKTVADENVRYGSLINGDFSYPSFSDIQKNEQENVADLRTFLKSDDGTLWYNMSNTDLSKYGKIGQIPGFDSSRFAWSSTENGSRVELQQDRNTKNTYAEIVAQQDNTSIYQNVSTGNGGVLYKIRLKHANRQSSHADRMQVLVGSDTDHATPVEMTRVISNGHGDKVGGKSTIITTKVSNTDPRDHGAQWETYEGYYQVPEGQKNTVFMFKSLEGFKEDETLSGNNIGNLVDDIEFSRSYKLTYDKNSDDATGSVPSDTTANTVKQAKAKSSGTVRLAADRTDGKVSDLVQRTTTHADGSVTVRTVDTTTDVVSGCQVYYPAGQKITLATMAKDDDCWDSSMLSRPGHTQLGWSQDRNATQAQAEVTMVEGGMTVFAVWVGNPVLTYDTNKPSTWSGQMPSTPASVSVPYNTAAADGSGWRAGDTSKLRGYRFLGWYTGPQNNAGLYNWNTLLTGNVTVYAHWQRLQANVIYDANGGTGSHAPTTGWQYSDVTIPGDTSKSFKRSGFRFAGWNTAKDGKGTAYADGSKVPLQDRDVTLYAQWKPLFDVLPSAGGDYGPSVPWLVCGGLALVALAGGVASTLLRLRRARGAHSR